MNDDLDDLSLGMGHLSNILELLTDLIMDADESKETVRATSLAKPPAKKAGGPKTKRK